MNKEMKRIVFYDGQCKVCAWEMSKYQKVIGHENLLFVNIHNQQQFNHYRKALTFNEAMKAMHVLLPSGKFTRGIDAFISIWEVCPNYKILAKIFNNPLVRPFALVAYKIFAKLRKYLPKNKDIFCDNDNCHKEL